MQDSEEVWKAIASKYHLRESDINKLVSWWHTDADLRRSMEAFTDMSKCHKEDLLAIAASVSTLALGNPFQDTDIR